MIQAVQRAMKGHQRLVVEAGTGVGKSFAYLLPAVEHILKVKEEGAASRASGKGRVVVSTHTIALQEQLIQKDIPLIQSVIPEEFTAVLVKGRGNYISLRRLRRADERAMELFGDPVERRTLEEIQDWARKTDDGSLATLPQLERPTVWDKVQSDSEDCMGRRCPTYQKCFYQAARRRMENADLLVVNHALFFADLSLRSDGAGILPAYEHVVLDEAHTVEDVAAEYFGLGVSRFQVHLLLSTLWRANGKGLLGALMRRRGEDAPGLPNAVRLARDAQLAADQLFEDLIHWHETEGRSNGRIDRPAIVDDPLSPMLKELALSLKLVRDRTPDDNDDDKLELDSLSSRCESIAGTLTALREQTPTDSVYWLEISKSQRISRVKWRSAPIDVGPLLREHLFEKTTSAGANLGVVLTSATLATRAAADADGRAGERDDAGDADPRAFAHLTRRLGVDNAATLQLGSPFDYRAQAELLVEANLPDPNEAGHFEKLCPRILHHIDRSDGGAFVLFTSYSVLRRVAEWLRPRLEDRGMPMMVHGEGMQRSELLARFRSDRRSVLLGTDSFWQGVDVRGEALRNVIITRLPFSPPDEPLTEARTERIKARGGNAFAEYSLPEAILKFKQGFGRLIRSKQDRGTVVVLDSRIMTKRYGRSFLEALPPLPVTSVVNDGR